MQELMSRHKTYNMNPRGWSNRKTVARFMIMIKNGVFGELMDVEALYLNTKLSRHVQTYHGIE